MCTFCSFYEEIADADLPGHLYYVQKIANPPLFYQNCGVQSKNKTGRRLIFSKMISKLIITKKNNTN